MGRFNRGAPSAERDAQAWSRIAPAFTLLGISCLFVAAAERTFGRSFVAGVDGVALGAASLAYARHLRRRALTKTLPIKAFQKISNGELAEAERLLSLVPKARGRIETIIGWHRASIALYGCAPVKAIEVATLTLDETAKPHGDGEDRALVSLVQGLRALALASAGDIARAETDAVAVRSNADAHPRAVAQSELARAVVDARQGAFDALAARLGAHGAAMTAHLGPQDRALVSALRRTVRVRGKSAYRTPAIDEGDELRPRPPATAQWIAMVLTEEHDRKDDAERTASTSGDVPSSPRARQSWRVALENWWAEARAVDGVAAEAGLVLLMIAAGAGYLLWIEDRFPVHALWSPLGTLARALAPLAVVAAIFRAFVWRGKRTERPLHQLMIDLERAQRGMTNDLLEDPTNRGARELAIGEQLCLAERLERNGQPERAMGIADAVIWRLDAEDDSLSRDALLPGLLALRAGILPMIGNPDEAEVELASLERTFPDAELLPLVRWQVQLRCALARHDSVTALAVAKQRHELELSTRDDALAALVLVEASSASDREVPQLASALEDDGVRRWLDRAAPGLRRRAAPVRRARIALDRELTVQSSAKDDHAGASESALDAASDDEPIDDTAAERQA